jgi:hypothetical protein
MRIFSRRETPPPSQWHTQLLVARTFGLIGVGIVATYSLALRSFKVLSVGAMVGAAALLAGALLGFLSSVFLEAHTIRAKGPPLQRISRHRIHKWPL